MFISFGSANSSAESGARAKCLTQPVQARQPAKNSAGCKTARTHLASVCYFGLNGRRALESNVHGGELPRFLCEHHCAHSENNFIVLQTNRFTVAAEPWLLSGPRWRSWRLFLRAESCSAIYLHRCIVAVDFGAKTGDNNDAKFY